MSTPFHTGASARDPRSGRAQAVCALAGSALVLGALTVMVLRHHSIRAWSDPVNWLVFARELGREFFTSRHACGYPLFLRLILPLTGPYGIFFSNLPLIAGVIAGAGILAAMLTPGPPARRAAAAAFAVLILATFDPWLIQAMTNPYRDPLSHLLLLGAMGLAAAELPRERWRGTRAITAGTLFGLAFSVREPALLAGVPLGGLVLTRARRVGAAAGRAVALALAGALLGAAPLLAQGLLRRGGGGLLPPQALAEQRWLPGLHWVAFGEVAPQVLEYLTQWPRAALLFSAPLVLGLVTVVRERNSPAAVMLAAPTAIYTLFYCFYWTFVPRYLWIAVVFGSALGGIGVTAALGALLRRSPWGERTAAVVATVACALGAVWLLSLRPTERRFTVQDARALAREVAARIPAGTKVLARRHFCEIIRWFNHLDAYPASWHWAANAHDPSDSLRERLAPEFASGRPVWCAEVRSGGRRDIEWAAVRRAFDVIPAGVEPLDLADFSLTPARVDFWRLRPWSSTGTVLEVYVPEPGMRLELDARAVGAGARLMLRRRPSPASTEVLADRAAVRGANFFALGTHTGLLEVVLSAPAGVPAVPGIRLYRAAEPVLLDFDPTAEPWCGATLGEGFLLPPYGQSCPRVFGRAEVRVPADLVGPDGADLQLRWRGTRLDRARSIGLRVSSGSHSVELRAPCDRAFRISDARAAPADPDGPVARLHLEVRPEMPGHGIEIEWIAVRARQAAKR
ncbi:MAG: hypothetical protein N2652_02990 [Kiritimatiellae bacterium]|nr:hypothetical protein [Kiritimatiellia bacterium]